jgi:methylated-DNA-protein-cysteine methyltransferase related protein
MNNFFEKVYSIIIQIPTGKVATYGQIAALLGNPRGARTVGWAMKSAPENMKLPCHRVVNRLGTLAPSGVFGGEEIQRIMLKSEGVSFKEDGTIDMKKNIWKPEV